MRRFHDRLVAKANMHEIALAAVMRTSAKPANPTMRGAQIWSTLVPEPGFGTSVGRWTAMQARRDKFPATDRKPCMRPWLGVDTKH